MAARRDTSSGKGWSPRRLILLGCTAVVAALVGSVFLWSTQRQRQVDKVVAVNTTVARLVRHDVMRGVKERVTTLERMATRWVMQGSTPKPLWEADVKALQKHQQGYQAIYWVDPSYQVRWVMPLEGNEAAVNLDLSSEETRRISLETSRETRQPVISKTIDLVQGGRGFLAYVPLFIDEAFEGFILGVFRVEDMFNQILKDHRLGEHFIAISDEAIDMEVYARPSTGRSTHDEWLDEAVVDYLDMTWRVKVWPGPDLLARHLSNAPDFVLGLGLFTALLLMLSTRLAYTAAKRNEALARSEATVRAMFDSAADGMVTIQQDGVVESFNPAASRIFGYAADEIVGRSVTLLLPEENRDGHMEWLDDFLGTGESRRIGKSANFDGLRKGGERIRINLSVSEVLIGGVPHFTGILRDITELHRVQEELSGATERFELAVAGSHDGLWDWSIPTGAVYYSPRFKEQVGYEDHELENVLDTWDSRLHAEDRDRVWRQIRDHLDNQVPFECEHRLLTKSGVYRWFLARGQALWDEDGQPVRMLGSYTDVTHHKVAELELSQARDAALESDRMKTEFLANMSHELRTPLNGIIGHSEILLEDMTDPEMIDDVRRIHTAGQHLLALVDDLLNLERISAGKTTLNVEIFDVHSVVEDVAAMVQPMIETNGNRLEWSVDASIGRLHTDAVKLRQILFNLLSNAAKFTTDGGITLDVLPESHGGEAWILLRVKDEGIGIPTNKLPRIFESFTQADSTISRAYGGTGLGLTLTQRLSRLLGGDIEVSSEVGRGSTFEVRLPQRVQVQGEEGEESEDMDGEVPAVTHLGGSRVLVVDDNEDNRNVMCRRLRRAGYAVDEARGGAEALESIDANTFDIVLLDIMMPDINGIEVLQTIRESQSRTELPVIMVTAKGMSEDIVEALEAGANDYVTKPPDMPVICARIEIQLELLRLRRQREQLMSLKDEFLAIASHDLRNPLSRVLGYTSLVAARALPGQIMTEQSHVMLGKVERAAHVMQTIIEDFLELAAVEGGRMRLDLGSLDVNALCSEAVSEMRPAAEEQEITLHLDLAEGMHPVMGDERRIRQVIQNLLDNAIKYCRAGDRVLVRSAEEEEGTRIEVCDTGPGLSPADMRVVFTRFAEMSARPREGERSSRLGLSIVRQIVMLHGGDVGVNNNEDGGATFWVILRRRIRSK
jgi:PAS domain S-box-containing protein